MTSAAPLPAEAQQGGTPTRIGVLCLIACQGLAIDALRRALHELGYVEGRTVVFEYRDAGSPLWRRSNGIQ
jgi:hypothetical protein